MRRATRSRWTWAAVVGAALAPAAAAEAAPVTDFFTLKASPATTLSGTGNTDDPVLGTGATTADAARMIGYFPDITLANTGDFITLSYGMSFTAGTIANASDNWRYALYDRNGETAETTNSNLAVVGNDNTDAFRGYWFGVDTNPNPTGVQGTLRERNVVDGSQDDPFANASATNISTPTGTATLAAATAYTGTMTITRTGLTEVTITGSFTGNGSNTWSFVDATAITFTYGVVGFLNGGNINADQVTFSNVLITTNVPEPASMALLGLGGLLVRRRRRVVW